MTRTALKRWLEEVKTFIHFSLSELGQTMLAAAAA